MTFARHIYSEMSGENSKCPAKHWRFSRKKCATRLKSISRTLLTLSCHTFFILRYRGLKSDFAFESGRKAKSGEGWFMFKTKDAEVMFKIMLAMEEQYSKLIQKNKKK